MLKNLSSGAICVLLLLLVVIIADNNVKLASLQSNLSQMKIKVSDMEKRQTILKLEIAAKTDPQYVDASLKEYFSRLLRGNKDQVRGVDGKMPSER